MRKLPDAEALKLASRYRIPLARTFLARNEKQAVLFAKKVKYPLALKIASPDIIHKVDSGGVVLGIKDEKALREGFQLHHRPVKHGYNGICFPQADGFAQGRRAKDAQVTGGCCLLFSRRPFFPAFSATGDDQTESDQTDQEKESWSVPHGRLLSPLPSYEKTPVNGKTKTQGAWKQNIISGEKTIRNLVGRFS